MIDETALRAVSPRELASTRAIAHQTVQLLTCVARNNLPTAADDSHSNLEWDADQFAFLTQPISNDDAKIRIGATFAPLSVFVSKDGEVAHELELDSKSVGEAAAWIDDHLEGLRLKPSSDIELPYDLPDDVAAVSVFDVKRQEAGLATLAEWFAFANQIVNAGYYRLRDQ